MYIDLNTCLMVSLFALQPFSSVWSSLGVNQHSIRYIRTNKGCCESWWVTIDHVTIRVLPKFWSRRRIKWSSRGIQSMLSYMECFSLVTAASQSEPVFERRLQPDSSDGVAKFLTKLSSLFSQKHLWMLGSLRKLYLFRNVFTQGKVGIANGKVAVGCKTKYLFFLLFGSK